MAISMVNEALYAPEFNDSTYTRTEEEYWAAWEKENPKPVVKYWVDDSVFEDNRTYQTDDKVKEYICPQHGQVNKLTKAPAPSPTAQNDMSPENRRNKKYFALMYGCPFCDLQQRYMSEPDYAPKFKNEKNPLGLNPYWWNVIYTLSKHGYKGNQIPMDYKALEALFIWRQMKDQAQRDWTAYVALHANDFAIASQNVSLLLEKARSGEITINTPSKKIVGRKDSVAKIAIPASEVKGISQR